MSRLFFAREKFNEDLSDWDVSSVTKMAGMFEGAKLYNRI